MRVSIIHLSLFLSVTSVCLARLPEYYNPFMETQIKLERRVTFAVKMSVASAKAIQAFSCSDASFLTTVRDLGSRALESFQQFKPAAYKTGQQPEWAGSLSAALFTAAGMNTLCSSSLEIFNQAAILQKTTGRIVAKDLVALRDLWQRLAQDVQTHLETFSEAVHAVTKSVISAEQYGQLKSLLTETQREYNKLSQFLGGMDSEETRETSAKLIKFLVKLDYHFGIYSGEVEGLVNQHYDDLGNMIAALSSGFENILGFMQHLKQIGDEVTAEAARKTEKKWKRLATRSNDLVSQIQKSLKEFFNRTKTTSDTISLETIKRALEALVQSVATLYSTDVIFLTNHGQSPSDINRIVELETRFPFLLARNKFNLEAVTFSDVFPLIDEMLRSFDTLIEMLNAFGGEERAAGWVDVREKVIEVGESIASLVELADEEVTKTAEPTSIETTTTTPSVESAVPSTPEAKPVETAVTTHPVESAVSPTPEANASAPVVAPTIPRCLSGRKRKNREDTIQVTENLLENDYKQPWVPAGRSKKNRRPKSAPAKKRPVSAVKRTALNPTTTTTEAVRPELLTAALHPGMVSPLVGPMASRMAEMADTISFVTNQMMGVANEAVTMAHDEETMRMLQSHAKEIQAVQAVIEALKTKTYGLRDSVKQRRSPVNDKLRGQ